MANLRSNCEPSGNRHSKQNLKNKRRIKGYILNERQIDFLRNKPYLYNCYVNSILENLFLQKFWYRISLYVPLWVAPCTLTCIGLLVNVITCAILIYYCGDAKQTVPNYWFIICGFGLFIYQLFDALDGKQAVKVQDTPIEEVYDHGCDAVSALFVTQSVTIATRLGYYPFMQFIFFLIPLIAFYMTHFSCHVTHVMHFGRIDVIEGQWVLILVHTITYFYGQQIWSTEVINGLTITHILFVMTVMAILLSITSNTCLILGADSPMDKLIRIPRKSDKSKWNPFYCLIILTLLTILGYMHQLFHTNPLLFIFLFGLAFAKLSFKLQVQSIKTVTTGWCQSFWYQILLISLRIMNVSHEDMTKLDTCLIGPLFLVLNSYLKLVSMNGSLVITLLLAILDHIFYFIAVSIDMKRALDINIFSLKYPIGHKNCRNKNYGFNLNGTENGQAIRNIQTHSQILNYVYT